MMCGGALMCRPSKTARSLALFAVRRADIESFARDLEARGRARATVTRRLCTIAGFYKYAVEEELLDHSPAAHVRRPRVDYESHATALDRNELGAMLCQGIRDRRSARAERDDMRTSAWVSECWPAARSPHRDSVPRASGARSRADDGNAGYRPVDGENTSPGRGCQRAERTSAELARADMAVIVGVEDLHAGLRGL